MNYKKMYRGASWIGGPTTGSPKPLSMDINLGCFSEFNPLIYMQTFRSRFLAIVMRRATDIYEYQEEFIAPKPISTGTTLGYHGEDFNNNGAFVFTKVDLIRLSDSMNETDELIICAPDSMNEHLFKEDIGKAVN